MKVFFVGMHNKPGMSALDSRTMTGKVIDRIIEKIPATCIKTNLCDIDYFPKDWLVINDEYGKWIEKHKPQINDVIILLGRWVQENFFYKEAKIIKLTHPAGIFGPKNKDVYINDTATKINSVINSKI